MIQQVWNKKVVVIVQIDPKDIADQFSPLPLILQIPWNHYLAFYYEQIIAFFSSYTVYPWNQNQFHLTLKSQNLVLNGTQIIGHLVNLFKDGIEKPLQFTCHLRNRLPLPTIQIKKFFKYSLKASTAIRNKKFGASILTLQMSIQNVDRLFQSFKENNLNSYLGSNNFESGNLGFSFIISKTERIPVKIIAKDFILERGVEKDISLSQFLAIVFQQAKLEQKENSQSQKKIENREVSQIKIQSETNDSKYFSQKQNSNQSNQTKKQQHLQKGIKYNYLLQKYSFYIHGVKLARGQYPLTFFQRFCHPDGFLYIFFEESNQKRTVN